MIKYTLLQNSVRATVIYYFHLYMMNLQVMCHKTFNLNGAGIEKKKEFVEMLWKACSFSLTFSRQYILCHLNHIL